MESIFCLKLKQTGVRTAITYIPYVQETSIRSISIFRTEQ
jgi:hypothetical protein